MPSSASTATHIYFFSANLISANIFENAGHGPWIGNVKVSKRFGLATDIIAETAIIAVHDEIVKAIDAGEVQYVH